MPIIKYKTLLELSFPSYKVHRLLTNFGQSVRPFAATMYLINSDAMMTNCLIKNNGRKHSEYQYLNSDNSNNIFASNIMMCNDTYRLFSERQVEIVGQTVSFDNIKEWKNIKNTNNTNRHK